MTIFKSISNDRNLGRGIIIAYALHRAASAGTCKHSTYIGNKTESWPHPNEKRKKSEEKKKKRNNRKIRRYDNRELCRLLEKSIKDRAAARPAKPTNAREHFCLFSDFRVAHSFWLNSGDLRPVRRTRRQNLGYYKELRFAAGDLGGGGSGGLYAFWFSVQRSVSDIFLVDRV